MAVERVIIEITGDTTKIQSTISELEKLGKVDKANADSFRKNNGRLITEFDRINAKLNAVTSEMKDLLVTGKRVPQELEAQYRSLKNQVDKVNNSFKDTNKDMGGLSNTLNSLKQQIIGAFAVSSLIAFGKEAVQTAVKIESIGNSLKFITGSSANAEKTMSYLRDLSNRLGLEFESTAQAFRLFAGAATQSGMSLGQTKSIFESVSKAATTMGLSADDANGVFLALSQIMSKGTVQAEELRSQIGERIPGAFAIAARSIGVTEQQLNKMLEQGQVISKDFLPKFAKQLEKDLGGGADAAADSTQAALNRMSNAWSDFKKLVADDLINPIIRRIGDLTKAMSGLSVEQRVAKNATTEISNEFKVVLKDLENMEFAETKYLRALEIQAKLQDGVSLNEKKRAETIARLGERVSTYNTLIKEGLFKTLKEQGEGKYLEKLSYSSDKVARDLVAQIYAYSEGVKVYGNELEMINGIIAETKQTLTQGTNIDEIIAKFKEFGEKAKTANTKQEITDIGRAVRDYYSSLEKGVKPEVKKYYYDVLDLLKRQNVELKDLGKTPFELLTEKAAKMEKALLDLFYAKKYDEADPLARKLRQTLAQIEMVKDQAEMAKNGLQKIPISQGTQKGGTPEVYRNTIDLIREKAQFDEYGRILIKGHIGVVEKLINGEKKLVYDMDQWRNEYFIQQAKDRAAQVEEIERESYQRRSEETAKFWDDQDEKQKQIRQIELDTSMQLINIGLDYAYQAKQREYDYELRLLDDMLAKKKISEDEYNRRKKEIQQKDAESQKEYAVFKATLDTANAILNALATGGTAAPALAIAAGVVGAAQIGAILATPLPQYAEGTDFVELGKNKKGKDTIPALLNEGEAVITTEQNSKYPGMAKAWNDGKLDEHIYKKWVLPELVMNKSFEQQKQRSFAENVAKSIQLNQDFGVIENKLKRIDETEKAVGAMIVGAIKESKNKNIW